MQKQRNAFEITKEGGREGFWTKSDDLLNNNIDRRPGGEKGGISLKEMRREVDKGLTARTEDRTINGLMIIK